MIRRLASLRGDTRGASIVEFALVLPVLLLLLCGAIDLGYMYMAQTTLNGALMQAAQVASSSMEKPEADRLAALKSGIVAQMAAYSGQQPTVTATVYHSFGESLPEDYTDANHNGKYDGPTPSFPGEAYTDRNGNGHWDADAPVKTGASTMGDVGDVVSYSATLKVRHLFGIIDWAALDMGGWGDGDATLKSYAVMRNEAAKTA